MSDKELPDLDAAVAQLAEYFGFDAHYDFQIGGEPYRITYRQFLPVEVERKLQEVEKSLEDCDHTETVLPNGKKVKGVGYAIPLRRGGVLLPDSRDALRLIAMWGEEKYRRFEAAGGPPDMLTVVWAKQETQYQEWRRAGSKSADRD